MDGTSHITRYLLAGLIAFGLLPFCAVAQVPGLPNLPGQGLPGAVPRALDLEPQIDQRRLARQLAVDRLVRANRETLERDPSGFPALRGRVVAVDPTGAALVAATEKGFRVYADERLSALELRIVTLLSPEGMTTRRALRALRKLDPDGSYDYAHVYQTSDSHMEAQELQEAPARAFTDQTVDTLAADNGASRHIGMLDGGVAPELAASANTNLIHWGCNQKIIPNLHGTTVASLLTGGTQQPAPPVTLYSADIYCAQPTGGNILSIVLALNWLADQPVSVINISIVGAPNLLLEKAINSITAQSIRIVAAVGNDGPTAKPLYPAAYPGVVAVTGVNKKRRVLPEAVRGRHISFAAPGAAVPAVSHTGALVEVRGTSYAAPIVAFLLASQADPDDNKHTSALTALIAEAVDLGRNGRDSVYGYGLLGEAFWGSDRDSD